MVRVPNPAPSERDWMKINGKWYRGSQIKKPPPPPAPPPPKRYSHACSCHCHCRCCDH